MPPIIDPERADLADQLRALWEREITEAGFVCIDGPSEGVAQPFIWRLPGFEYLQFPEGETPMQLLAGTEERCLFLRRGIPGQRGRYDVTENRAAVRRMARTRTVDWRMALDETLTYEGVHPFIREERREVLWAQVTRRGIAPRLED